jgi:Tol biopolymer transport system component/DNA-binding winged helix-turn-helix (wHTH) protein
MHEMSEKVVSIRSKEIDLGGEKPFDVGGTHVRPAALELEHGGAVTSVEPRVMKVLVALNRARGAPLSRDALIDQCWEGRIVTESAINRCVSQLRKALNGDASIGVETIPKIGYRLKTGVLTAEATKPADAPPQRTLALKSAVLLAAAAGTALAGALLFMILRPAPSWTAVDYRPLTSAQEIETFPALSPDGAQIVYTVQAEPGAGEDLYLRAVDGGAPVRLTTNPANEFGAEWSPQGDRIAFVRHNGRLPCSLVTMPVPGGPERVVGGCEAADYTRITWIDENTLAISDQPSEDQLRRIRAVDIETGAMRDLTEPRAGTLGDNDPQASPDGRYVLFRRTLMHGADDLYLVDVRTGEERALTTDGWKAPGYVWSADSRHVFFSSNREGGFGLWTVNAQRPGPPKRVSLGLGALTFTRMSMDRNNRLAVEANRGRTNLAAMTAGGAVRPVTDGAGEDWGPQVSAEGDVAFVSMRSGLPELWVTGPEGAPNRITDLGASYITRSSWSQDGSSIAFTAVRGRRAELYIVGRDGSRLRALTDDGIDKIDPAFSVSGNAVYYIEHAASGWRLMRVGLEDGAEPEPAPGGENWRSLRAGAEGRLFGVRQGSGNVIALGGGEVPDVTLDITDDWTVGEEGVFVLRGRYTGSPSLWLYPWDGGERKVSDLPPGADWLSASAGGGVVFARPLDRQVDIGLLQLGG